MGNLTMDMLEHGVSKQGVASDAWTKHPCHCVLPGCATWGVWVR